MGKSCWRKGHLLTSDVFFAGIYVQFYRSLVFLFWFGLLVRLFCFCTLLFFAFRVMEYCFSDFLFVNCSVGDIYNRHDLGIFGMAKCRIES